MSDAFYKAFEDKYRGSRTLIKSLLQVYQPYLQGLRTLYPNGQALDLVCGRGEWLEILGELEFDAQGVDIDRTIVEICRQRGLNVRQCDPLEALMGVADASQVIVTGFHLAEHIAFGQLKKIAKEAFRVLKPGGLFILETPNPENMLVGSNSFYFDPRHAKPIPPLLLAFVPEYYGFEKIKLLRMQEQVKSSRAQPLSLYDVLSGASPTYAVIAQKTPAVGADFDIDTIEPLRGVKLDALSYTFDQQLEQQFARLKATASEALALAKDAEDKLDFIHQSLSWKLAAPVRWLDHQHHLLKELGPLERVKALIRKIITSVVNRVFNFVSVRPGLNKLGLTLAQKSGLYDRLCAYLVKPPVEIEIVPLTPEIEAQAYKTHLRLEQMDTQAHAVFAELKSAIENKEGLR
jgi:O-antigen chain-terminating methyltransferase